MAHHTGQGVAGVCGRRQAPVFLARKVLVAPLGIPRSCTDGWGADERHVAAGQPTVGQATPQKSTSKPINVRTRRTRLVRRTLGFAKTERRHDVVIGLFSNRYEFGV